MANGFNFARKPFENERLPRLVFTVAAGARPRGDARARVLSRTLPRPRARSARHHRGRAPRRARRTTESSIASAEATLARQQTALGNERTAFPREHLPPQELLVDGLFNELEEIHAAAVRITSIAPFEEDGEISVTLTLVGRTFTNVLRDGERARGQPLLRDGVPARRSRPLRDRRRSTRPASPPRSSFALRRARPSEEPKRLTKRTTRATALAAEDERAMETTRVRRCR